MQRLLSVLGLAVLLAAAPAAGAVAQEQSSPPSGPRDRVRRHRERAAEPEQPKPAKPPRQRRGWPGRGAVVVVPPSEISSSTDRTRGDGPGVAPRTVNTAAALVGFDETRLKAALGQPALARNEGQGAMWTYRLRTCALHVFLSRDGAGALRVKGAASGPLVRGGATPGVDACVAEAAPG
jgi:hypothetical protein